MGWSSTSTPIQPAKFCNDCALKVSPLVGVQSLWHSILEKPLFQEYLSGGIRLLITCGERLKKLSEDVRHHQDVFSAVRGRLLRGKINSYHLQWLESQKRGPGCPNLRLRQLSKHTVMTILHPGVYSLMHPCPIAPWLEQAQGSLNSLVSHLIMEYIIHHTIK